MHRKLRPALAWAVLIGVLCLTPGSALPTWEWADLLSVDKLVHMAMFAVMTVLLAYGLAARDPGHGKQARILLMAALISIGYGGAMEVLQEIPVLHRRGDLVDLTANTLGALAGFLWMRARWNKQRRATEAVDA